MGSNLGAGPILDIRQGILLLTLNQFGTKDKIQSCI